MKNKLLINGNYSAIDSSPGFGMLLNALLATRHVGLTVKKPALPQFGKAHTWHTPLAMTYNLGSLLRLFIQSF